MATVLIVSRNPAMAMGLSSTDHDVVELRPQVFGSWIENDEEHADALILDLESPQLAAAAVANLRAHSKLAPVLLVSSDRPGWDSDDMRHLPGAEVLPLPINLPALLAALERLLVAEWAVDPGAAIPPHHHEVAEALHELSQDSENLLVDEDELESLITHRLAESRLRARHRTLEDVPLPPSIVARDVQPEPEPTAVAAVEPLPEPEPAAAAAVEPLPKPPPAAVAVNEPASATDAEQSSLSAVPRTRRSTRLPVSAAGTALKDLEALRPTTTAPAPQTVEPLPPRRAETAAGKPKVGRPSPVTATPSAPVASDDAIALVRHLSRLVSKLYGVPETAEVIVTDAVDRTNADAGALLVPDDGCWRVSAGVGLRPLEHRYELHADSWLVQQVAHYHKGAIVEESDVAREQLQGAPLASWRHLLAAPVPQVAALLILARREDPPFDESDLAALASLGSEAGPLLAAAIDTRSLARSMWEFRDEVDLPR